MSYLTINVGGGTVGEVAEALSGSDLPSNARVVGVSDALSHKEGQIHFNIGLKFYIPEPETEDSA